ncbi:uncharacterized protein LOC122672276 [Telopea speciosissima]|uniref:uncharacterized protein LOC122672276 n=1 Tax=Telopea speciosissima TaxID=54955 RepID=UPI001CC552D4|nr:uncharacterized protein LOC122672276 [Telopea speciosissima]
MATSMNDAHTVGLSITRPPRFNGLNYNHWKVRMKIFLQSLDYDIWKSIWTSDDKLRFTLNAKAMNALYCALSLEESDRIFICKTAKEIWRTLELTHEDTKQVKDCKSYNLVSQYELFKMKSDESIKEMYTRFTNIVNELKSLGIEYPTVDLVNKIL